MQGDQLVPGGKNVLAGGADLHAPHRLGRDRTFNPLKNLGKSASREVGAHFFGLLFRLRALVVVMSEGGDDGGAQLGHVD